jgi:GT2 family glycosyltransferase
VAVPDLTIISVAFNSRDQICDALKSAAAAASALGLSYEVVVVDNASTDHSAAVVRECLPHARLRRNRRNVGFGTANNQAFERALGDRWLLLNPDARIDSECLDRLWQTLTAFPDVAAVAPSTAGEEDRIEDGGMLPGIRSIVGTFLFLNRLLPDGRGGPWRGMYIRRRGTEPREVEWIGAAVMLARSTAIRDVRGFDSSIFMYGEDIDLGARLSRGGWRLMLDPGAHASHAIAGSQGGVSDGWVDGTLLVYGRDTSRRRQRLAAAIMAIGLAIRVAASGAREPLHRRRMRSAMRRALRWCAGVPPLPRQKSGRLLADSPT